MEPIKEMLLQAFQASLQKKTVAWEAERPLAQWQQLFELASEHHILPMVYEAVIRSNAAKKADQQIFAPFKKQVMQVVMLQTIKTNAFLRLLPNLLSAGVTPLVVKGIICRELYPNPDYRISSDEDVLIPEDQFASCHMAMLASGLSLMNPQQDLNDFEIPYRQQGGPLYIELHKQLFHPDSDAYSNFNRFFAGVQERSIMQTLQGIPVPTMNHTDHLFYLICHSFKHFLHSGFGIRQVCDICLYANAFGTQIEWLQVLRQCEDIHAELFAASLFRIGEKYLTFQPEIACYPEQWSALEVDEMPMLEDLMDSGVFGTSSMSRRHSSNLTLNAVTARKQGKKGSRSVFKTIFPSAKNLSGRYPYLMGKPYLLPIAWADRILKYGKETVTGSSGNSAAESLKIGNQRIELLRQYGIIDRE